MGMIGIVSGCDFASDEEVLTSQLFDADSIPKPNILQEAILHLVSQWDKFLNQRNGYK